MTKRIRLWVLAAGAAFFLSGCQAVTKEQLALREQGIACMEQGDYAGAVEQFDQAVTDSRRVTEFEEDVLKYRAEAEFMLKDYGAAAHTYEILSQIDEERPEYFYFWGLNLARSGDAEGAAEKIGQAAALDSDKNAPGYTEAMEALGEAWLSAGNQEQAEAVYQELLNSGKADAGVYNRLALADMEAGNYEKALEYIEQGLALGQDGDAARELLFNQAVCREYLGEYEQALELFRTYAEKFGEDETVRHEIAFLETR